MAVCAAGSKQGSLEAIPLDVGVERRESLWDHLFPEREQLPALAYKAEKALLFLDGEWPFLMPENSVTESDGADTYWKQ